MRTLATKQLSNQDSARQKPVRTAPMPVMRSRSTGLPGSVMLQRKPSCACGGGCPRCQEVLGIQTKLRMSEPEDQYEQEADCMADQVMRMPEPSMQRQTELEEEEKGIVQRQTIDQVISLNQEKSSSKALHAIRVSSVPGAYTESEYRDWQRQHPNSSFALGGPWEAEFIYTRYTPEWFWSKGYFYAGNMYGGFQGAYFEIWLNNEGKGKEFRVFRNPKENKSDKPSQTTPTTRPPQAQQPPSPPLEQELENPQSIDPSTNPEAIYGSPIQSRDNAEIFGQRGRAIEYTDGTILLYLPNSRTPLTFRPRFGDAYGAYDFYGQNGQKAENIVIGIDPDEVFSPTTEPSQ